VAIDVYMSEPAIDSPLIGMPMVLATSHIGGSTHEAIMAMGRAAITQLVDVYLKT
jgi:D-3-phosphoglycerate dehydrogenase